MEFSHASLASSMYLSFTVDRKNGIKTTLFKHEMWSNYVRVENKCLLHFFKHSQS